MAKSIDISTSKHHLKLFENGRLIKTYPIGVGRMVTPTPAGTYTIINKQRNPGGPFGVFGWDYRNRITASMERIILLLSEKMFQKAASGCITGMFWNWQLLFQSGPGQRSINNKRLSQTISYTDCLDNLCLISLQMRIQKPDHRIVKFNPILFLLEAMAFVFFQHIFHVNSSCS